MDPKTEAAIIRKTVDQEALKLALSCWPNGEHVPQREFFDAAPYLKKLPADLDDRRAEAERLLEKYKADEVIDICYYNKIKETGPEALTDYDLTIAYGGDAIRGSVSALRLKLAHISFDRSMIFALVAELLALDEAVERERPQMALF